MPENTGAPRPGPFRSPLVVVIALVVTPFVAPVLSAQGGGGTPLHRNIRTPSQGTGRRALVSPMDGTAMYHNGATLLCSDCHSAHFGESHGFDGGAVSTTTAVADGDWLPASGPNGYLLKASSSTKLCLSCHDGQTFAPDVVETDTYGLTQRAAGFFGNTDVLNFRGHNLASASLGRPGDSSLCDRCHFVGTMATAQVQCIDCHNPHGNASYRNLWWASAPGAEPPILASIKTGSTGKLRYEAANVAYPAPPAGDGWVEVTNMCVDCHHTFFAPWYTNTASPYHRHPGTNTESGGTYPINKTGANTDAANWVSGAAGFSVPRLPFAAPGASSFASASVVAGNNEVFCLTCHKAHGSENPFSLRWDYGAKTATGTAGCQQCHNNVFME
ncbi:MAG: cytochrome c3 family protein [Acidobacteriota bacterium]